MGMNSLAEIVPDKRKNRCSGRPKREASTYLPQSTNGNRISICLNDNDRLMTPLKKPFSEEKRDVYLVCALRAHTRYSNTFSATALKKGQFLIGLNGVRLISG